MSQEFSAVAVIAKLEEAGYRLEPSQDGSIRFYPRSMPPELREQLIAVKDEAIAILTARRPWTNGERSRLDALRVLAPAIWQKASLLDGRNVLIWGVTPHGVIVSPDPKQPLITVEPDELRYL